MREPTPASQRRERDFVAFLTSLFINDQRGELARIADRLGLKYDALYRRVRGTVAWRPEELRLFIAACTDARVAQWFLEESTYIAVDRVPPIQSSGGMIHAVSDAIRQTVDIWETLAAFGDFETLTESERLKLLREVREAEQVIANIRSMVLDRPARSEPPAR